MQSRHVFFLFLLLGVFLSGFPEAEASVSNQGNEAVRVKITRTDGRSRFTVLYPDQTISLPANAAEIQIDPVGALHGDEEMSVLIIEPDGTETIIEEYGRRFEFGTEYEPAGSETPYEVQNNSNVGVLTDHTRSSTSRVKTTRLNPGQSFTLPADTLEVTVRPDGGVWGDEKIEVEIILPDGSSELITRYGGRYKLVEERRAPIQFPSFNPAEPKATE